MGEKFVIIIYWKYEMNEVGSTWLILYWLQSRRV